MYQAFHHKKRAGKIIAYLSSAILFAAAPALSVSAAETPTQNAGAPAETPALPESQPAVNAAPAGTPDNTLPAQTAPGQETAAPQTPADTTAIPPQTPTDPAPQPEPAPAAQDFEVAPMQGTFYVIPQKGLNVRSGPSTDYASQGTLKYGQAVTVTGKTANNWYQIQYSGAVGYVRADYVSAEPVASAEPSVSENPAAGDLPASENPDSEIRDDAPADSSGSEAQDEDDNAESVTEKTSDLFGAPVIIVLGIAILGVLAMICYSVYSLFKRDNDDGYYEDGQYDDDGYYGDTQYSDDEYYEDEQYIDDEYYEDEYYENGQYSDDEYYENEQYSDDGYYENGYYEEEPYADGQYSDDDTMR